MLSLPNRFPGALCSFTPAGPCRWHCSPSSRPSFHCAIYHHGPFLKIFRASALFNFLFQFYPLPSRCLANSQHNSSPAFHNLPVLSEQYHIPARTGSAKLNINSWKCSSFLSLTYLLGEAPPKLWSSPVSRCLRCRRHGPGAAQPLSGGRLSPPGARVAGVHSPKFPSFLGCQYCTHRYLTSCLPLHHSGQVSLSQGLVVPAADGRQARLGFFRADRQLPALSVRIASPLPDSQARVGFVGSPPSCVIW